MTFTFKIKKTIYINNPNNLGIHFLPIFQKLHSFYLEGIDFHF